VEKKREEQEKEEQKEEEQKVVYVESARVRNGGHFK